MKHKKIKSKPTRKRAASSGTNSTTNSTTTLHTTRAYLRAFEKQAGAFVKPWLGKSKTPDAGETAAGVMYNPLTNTAAWWRCGVRPEIIAPFFGVRFEHSDGAYKFFCPLILTSQPAAKPPVGFPLVAFVILAKEYAKTGGTFECGGFVFEVAP